jgi:hypothetical protein
MQAVCDSRAAVAKPAMVSRSGAISGSGRMRVDDAALQPRAPVVAAGQQGVAGGRADAAAGMTVGEAQALRGQPVDGRRRDLPARRVVALDVAVAEVIGQNDQHVGRCAHRCGERQHRRRR